MKLDPHATEAARVWHKLHTLAASSLTTENELATAIKTATDGFPSDCSCGPHWIELCSKHPPPTKSGLAAFLWTVARHNDVNKKIGKRKMSPERAARAHGIDWKSLII